MEILNRAKQQILENLGQYKFLTNSQLVKLRIDKSKQNVNKYVKQMRDKKKPWVKTASFGVVPKVGKLEGVHYLTRHGKDILLELGVDEAEILYPKSNTRLFSQDYFHRKSVIDFQISLFNGQHEGAKVDFFHRYFDKMGSNRTRERLQAKTKITIKDSRYIISDAIFFLSGNLEKRLFCFEMCNGYDSGRIVKQLTQYVDALKEGSPSIKYHLNKSCKVLCVFEHQSTMLAVIRRLQPLTYFKNMAPFFFFATQEGNEYLNHWVDMTRKQVIFFSGWGIEVD